MTRINHNIAGRVIVSNPPLQQFHKECSFRDVDAAEGIALQNLIDELRVSKDQSFQEAIRKLNDRHQGSRVRVRRGSNTESSTEASSFSNGVLKRMTTAGIGQLSLPDGTSLAEYWRDRGVHYSEEDLQRVVQVLVELENKSSRSVYHYPADQVFLPMNSSNEDTLAALNDVNQWDKIIRGDRIDINPDVKRVNPRCGFRAQGGYVLLSVDYCQIELRLLAHFSNDRNLVAAFHEDHDVFKTIASKWLDKSASQVTAAERNNIKQVCYSYIYGAGPTFVAEKAQCSFKHAKDMMERFMAMYPGLKSFISSTKESCRENGYVETLLGRRRFLPEISSKDPEHKSRAERQAVNTVCQGSAADLIKLAMINAHHSLALLAAKGLLRFRDKRSSPGGALYSSCDDDARILLQVSSNLALQWVFVT